MKFVVVGMVRLSEIDQIKLGKELMKLSIKDISNKVSKLYFLQIGNIDNDILEFIKNLAIPYKITISKENYSSGWTFKNNESLDDLYKTIDDDCDWVLYPDMDDLLPENINEILETANVKDSKVIRFHFIECFGSVDDVIEIKQGYPIGPHFKAVKYSSNITFHGSDGFNEPKGPLCRYETNFCVRHLRYANFECLQKRKEMNYFQDYFLKNHNTIKFIEGQTINYYRK